jgi:SAM-dependent methyltransferase
MSDDYRELLIGCGRARDKRIVIPGQTSRAWHNLTTADINPNVDADLWVDLNAHPPWYAYSNRMPIESRVACSLMSDQWDEIHAYEVLEHLGQQGDAASFLAQFSELWRLLKPNGYLCATVPSRFSEWLWGDPSHRRAIVPASLVFLDQEQYSLQCDAQHPTNMSDFRDTCGYKADFRLIDQHDNRTTFTFIVQAVKPSRWKERT